ncbi:unnamed protein product [Amoebophrya sp. A25]|nr:unnamed protein product [Amoebophrya sp. A25]|eukprot:GSA25T00005794001.1
MHQSTMTNLFLAQKEFRTVKRQEYAGQPNVEERIRTEWTRLSKEEKAAFLPAKKSREDVSTTVNEKKTSGAEYASFAVSVNSSFATAATGNSSSASSCPSVGAGTKQLSFAAQMILEQKSKIATEKSDLIKGKNVDLLKRPRADGGDPDSLIGPEEAKRLKKETAARTGGRAARPGIADIAVPVFGKRSVAAVETACSSSPHPPGKSKPAVPSRVGSPTAFPASGGIEAGVSSSSHQQSAEATAPTNDAEEKNNGTILPLAQRVEQWRRQKELQGTGPRQPTLEDVARNLAMPQLRSDSLFDGLAAGPDELQVTDESDKRDVRTLIRDEVKLKLQEERMRATLALVQKNEKNKR